MQVPVRRQPQTQISDQQQGFEQAAPALNVEPITHLIAGFRNQLLDEQDTRQRIGLNRELLQEVNGLQADFAERQTDPNVSPIDFAVNTNTAYEQRHQELIGRLRQEGYHGEMLDDFENRLGTVRQGFFERGLVYQHTQLRARASQEIQQITTDASQYAETDYRNYSTARDTVRDSIRNHPDLTPEERVVSEDQNLAIVRDAASRRYAIQDPQGVITALDPQGLTAPTPPAAAPPATGTEATPPPAGDTRPYVHGWAPRRRNGGDNTDAQVDGYIGALAHGLGITPDTHLTEDNLPRFAQIQTQVESGGAPSARSVRNNNPGNIEDGHFARSQPGYLGGDGRFARFVSPQAGQNAQVALLRTYLGRGQTTIRSIIEGVPAHGAAPVQTASAEPVARAGADTVPDALQLTDPTVQNVDIPPSTSPQGQPNAASDVTTQPAVPHDITGIHTGNPLLDDLNGRERLQLLGLAREQLNRQTVSERAAMDVTVQNITSEAMNNGGEIATPMPTEQAVLHAYGAVEGPQKWAQLQSVHAVGQAITTFRTQSATDIQRSLDALHPVNGSPTYAVQQEVYNHAQEAAQTLLAARERDPAGYVAQYFPEVRAAAQQGTQQYYAALDRAYQTLGINPDTAPVMTADASRQMAEQYRTMSPSDRREFLRQNWSMGEDRFRRFVHGMEGTTAETDANIFALLRNYPRAAGPAGIIFQDVMIGRDAIAQDPARKPRAEEVTREFRAQGMNAIRDLNPTASRAVQDAAEGLYVQRGGNNNDGSLNTDRYRDALTTVLGGSMPVAMGHGRANQYYTILPPGTNQDQFRGWIDRQTLYSLSVAAGNRAPYYGDLRTPVQIQDIIDSGTFVMTSPGHYMIRMASDGRPLVDRRGQPFLLNIDRRAVTGPTPIRHSVWGMSF